MTFAKYPVVSGGSGSGDVVGPGSATNNAVVLFDGTTGKLIKDSAIDSSSLVLTSGNQTIGGTKTFSSEPSAPSIALTASSNQMIFGGGTFKTTVSFPGSPAANLTYTFPNIQAVSVTGTISLLEAANQTFSGTGTIFSQTVRFDASTPLWLGSSPNRVILSPGSQVSPRTWLFPDLSVDPTFAALEGTQSFSGDKTFAGTLTVPSSVNYTSAGSITKSGAGILTLTNASNAGLTFSGAFTLTVPATGTANLIDVAQTVSAIKTHSAAIAFTGGSAANGSIWFASNVLRQRGGTSGWAVDNTSGTAIISATDAGAVTAGPSTKDVNHVVNGRRITLTADNSDSGNARFFMNIGDATTNGSTFSSVNAILAAAGEDTGTTAVMQFQSDINTASAITTRPIFEWRNYNTQVGVVSAAGAWTWGTIPATSNSNSLTKHLIAGHLSVATPTGTPSGDEAGFFYISANACRTSGNYGNRFNATPGGTAILLNTRTSASNVAFAIEMNQPSDTVTTAATQVVTITHAGAVTLGPTSAIGGSTFAGAAIVGRTDGSAPSAGYVGQSVEGTQTSLTSFPATATYGDGTSVTLTSGRWLLSALIDNDQNGATGTLITMGIGTASGTSSAGLTPGDTQGTTLFPSSTANTFIAVPAVLKNITSSTTFYLKLRADYSAGTPRYRCRLTAIRIA